MGLLNRIRAIGNQPRPGDGVTRSKAMARDPVTGEVLAFGDIYAAEINEGPLGGYRNLLINGAFAINQRAFAGGSLSAAAYGFDRWKAGSGGCSVSVSSGTVTLNGPLVQVVESSVSLAGLPVAVSVEDPSGDISVTISDGGVNTETGTIRPGAGRLGVVLAVPSAATGNLTVQLATSASTTFKRAQLEIGRVATQFERRAVAAEVALCRRYFERIGGAAYEPIGVCSCFGTTQGKMILRYAVPKRTTPTVTIGNATSFLINNGTGYDATAVVADGTLISPRAVQITVTVASGLTSGATAIIYVNNNTAAHIDVDAEL